MFSVAYFKLSNVYSLLLTYSSTGRVCMRACVCVHIVPPVVGNGLAAYAALFSK